MLFCGLYQYRTTMATWKPGDRVVDSRLGRGTVQQVTPAIVIDCGGIKLRGTQVSLERLGVQGSDIGYRLLRHRSPVRLRIPASNHAIAP
jgi:hypothetical protein